MTVPDAWTGAATVLDQSQCPECHRDSCEDPAHAATDAEAISIDNLPDRVTDERLPGFLPASEVMTQPAPEEIVEGVASDGCVTVVAGEPAASKTFVLTDLSTAVSDDLEWHGRRVKQSSVAYISFEGDALGLRLQAMREAHGNKFENFYILRASAPLSPIIDRDRIEIPSRGETDVIAHLSALRDELAARERPPIGLVVIDTVRASLSGSEDSSENVSAYLRVVRRLLKQVPGAGAILSHHAGWQDGEVKKKRERGSSAFRGNVDATLFLEADDPDPDTGDTELTLNTLKVRDGERPAPLRLIRRRVVLSQTDAHGRSLTSCVIERDRRSREERDTERAQDLAAEHLEMDLTVLRAMRDYPAATSIANLRTYLGLRSGVVNESVARILQSEWALQGRRGETYQLTETGRTQLNGVSI